MKEEQKRVFMESEGDEWFCRNRDVLSSSMEDEIVMLLQSIELEPEKILEIGCCNGSRLEMIRKSFHAESWGIDPSAKAIEDGMKLYPELRLFSGTAESIAVWSLSTAK